MKDEICRQFNLDRGGVGVWTSGVSPTSFDPEKFSSRRSELRKMLGLTDKFVVFYHGVLTKTRGLQDTIQSIKTLKDKHSEIVFFLLGNGPMLSELKSLISQQGLQENVIIHNPVSHLEVPSFISMCDVGIVPLPDHPYWRPQSPLKLLEYLAMAKVVVLTDIPAHRNVVGEAKCAVFVPSVNPTEIAKAIEFVYENGERLKIWGKQGRKIIEDNFTWEAVARDLESYLLWLNDPKVFAQKAKVFPDNYDIQPCFG